MKLTSVAAIALLSGMSLAKKDECKASTATVTVTITSQAAVAPAPVVQTVTITSISSVYGGYSTGPEFNNAVGGGSSGGDSNYAAQGGSSGGSSGGSNGVNGQVVQVQGGQSGSGGWEVGGGSVSWSGAPTPIGPDSAMVTQHDIADDGKQTVLACPAKIDQSCDCFQAVYRSDGKLITAQAISLSVTTINGVILTKTVTKTEAPKMTPTTAPKAKEVDDGSGLVVTQIVDVTATTTKNGQTVYQTHTHFSTIIGTGTGSASNSKATHFVAVGKDDKKEFEPSAIKAKAGDTIRFTFFPRNHSVTTCSLQDPCISDGQFDSGFKFTFIKNSTTFIDFPVTDDNKALHFFSNQKGECKDGMVFGLNSDRFDEFKKNAKNFDQQRHGPLAQNSTWNGTFHSNEHPWNSTGSWNSTNLWHSKTSSIWNATLAVNATSHFNFTRHEFNATNNKDETKPTGAPVRVTYGGKRSVPYQSYGRDALPRTRRWFA